MKYDILKSLGLTRESFLIIAFALIGVLLFIANFFLFKISYLNFVAIIIVIIFPSILGYAKYRREAEIERRFPDFLRDVSENIRAGMTLPQAISSTKNTNYGALTPHVKKIAVQLDWGVTFDKIFEDFASKSTPVIKRTVATIIEVHRGGGNIADVFDVIGSSTVEINKIREERSSGIYSQMISGYMIFFVFLGILIALQTYLLPGLSSSTLQGPAPENLTGLYANLFKWLILIQGLFSGLVIGKMAEGNISAGLKHSLILMFIGYNMLVIFS